ncbi:MAG: YkgJ family cysteine cluster protein [Planctomycetaceae bacterium]|jgi:Fe-S-cluster containining protein|nr:YkgJ family cysteine cluster protein [Planctomycetaceae bacterium]
MNQTPDNTCETNVPANVPANLLETLKQEILNIVDEKFDVEAVAQMVEQLDNSKKIAKSLFRLQEQNNYNGFNINAIQNELRTLIMDVTLLKRALMSLGQIGVMERQRIEKELIIELFPPKQVRPGLGIVVAQDESKLPIEEDCEKRIHLCKQACCRIFEVHLNADEIESGQFDWNPRSPYSLHKNHSGCVHLVQCKCTIYHNRPATCYTYSCKNDPRIWLNYENIELNPSLKQRLIAMNLLPNEELRTDQDVTLTTESIKPPDFSRLRAMTVPEPANKFVPPPKAEQETIPT